MAQDRKHTERRACGEKALGMGVVELLKMIAMITGIKSFVRIEDRCKDDV